MAVYPNNYSSAVGWNPCSRWGILSYTEYQPLGGTRFNSFTSAAIPKSASIPSGYGTKAYVPPLKAGGMAAFNRDILTFSQSGSLLQGGPMVTGIATISLIGDDQSLSLVINLSCTAGTSIVTMDGDDKDLKLTMGISTGIATMTLTGDSMTLAMIIPIFSDVAEWSLSGISDLRGRLSLSGEWTPYTELSPENLAAAVWNALSATFNDPGTMGEKLNDAGSASNPWTEVLENGKTAAELMRIMKAALAGLTNKEGDDWHFRDDADTKDRIVGTVDGDGARTAVVVDGE